MTLFAFRARSPGLGGTFLLLGQLGIVIAALGRDQPAVLIGVLAVALLLWVVAWRAAVGSLWRSALVGSALAAGALLWAGRS